MSTIQIKSFVPNFHKRWLFDEVIDSYLQWLSLTQNMILVCESTIFLTRSTIQSSPSFKSLWLDQDVMQSEFIFAPFNTSNCHWVLVAVDMKQQKIMYTDPMCMKTPASDINFKRGIYISYFEIVE